VITSLDLDRQRRRGSGGRRAGRWIVRLVAAAATLAVGGYAACLIAMPLVGDGATTSATVALPVAKAWTRAEQQPAADFGHGVAWVEHQTSATNLKHRGLHATGLNATSGLVGTEVTIGESFAEVDATHTKITLTAHVRAGSGIIGALSYPVQKVLFHVSKADSHATNAFDATLAKIAAPVAAAQAPMHAASTTKHHARGGGRHHHR
jgi:hypothetical protein